jgi:hypothetical protein
MQKILIILGLSVGGWIGWAVGAPFGILAAFTLSVVGTGLGLYVGRRIARDYF